MELAWGLVRITLACSVGSTCAGGVKLPAVPSPGGPTSHRLESRGLERKTSATLLIGDRSHGMFAPQQWGGHIAYRGGFVMPRHLP